MFGVIESPNYPVCCADFPCVHIVIYPWPERVGELAVIKHAFVRKAPESLVI